MAEFLLWFVSVLVLAIGTWADNGPDLTGEWLYSYSFAPEEYNPSQTCDRYKFTLVNSELPCSCNGVQRYMILVNEELIDRLAESFTDKAVVLSEDENTSEILTSTCDCDGDSFAGRFAIRMGSNNEFFVRYQGYPVDFMTGERSPGFQDAAVFVRGNPSVAQIQSWMKDIRDLSDKNGTSLCPDL